MREGGSKSAGKEYMGFAVVKLEELLAKQHEKPQGEDENAYNAWKKDVAISGGVIFADICNHNAKSQVSDLVMNTVCQGVYDTFVSMAISTSNFVALVDAYETEQGKKKYAAIAVAAGNEMWAEEVILQAASFGVDQVGASRKDAYYQLYAVIPTVALVDLIAEHDSAGRDEYYRIAKTTGNKEFEGVRDIKDILESLESIEGEAEKSDAEKLSDYIAAFEAVYETAKDGDLSEDVMKSLRPVIYNEFAGRISEQELLGLVGRHDEPVGLKEFQELSESDNKFSKEIRNGLQALPSRDTFAGGEGASIDSGFFNEWQQAFIGQLVYDFEEVYKGKLEEIQQINPRIMNGLRAEIYRAFKEQGLNTRSFFALVDKYETPEGKKEYAEIAAAAGNKRWAQEVIKKNNASRVLQKTNKIKNILNARTEEIENLKDQPRVLPVRNNQYKVGGSPRKMRLSEALGRDQMLQKAKNVLGKTEQGAFDASFVQRVQEKSTDTNDKGRSK
jgi:hypothetical protein